MNSRQVIHALQVLDNEAEAGIQHHNLGRWIERVHLVVLRCREDYDPVSRQLYELSYQVDNGAANGLAHRDFNNILKDVRGLIREVINDLTVEVDDTAAPSSKPAPEERSSFRKRHPVLTDLYITVIGGLVLAAVLALLKIL